MARMKPCNANGCPTLVEEGTAYCGEHEHIEIKRKKESYERYNRMRVDSASQEFYNNSKWRKTRQMVVYKYNGLCLWSYYVDDSIVMADCVHHIVELKEDMSKGLDIDNLIPLSDTAHNKIHGRYNRSQASKEQTQKLLYAMKDRFSKTFGSDED